MKKIALTIGCLVSFAALAAAHPASSIDVKAADGMIEITTSHGTKDPASHFINAIDVSVNGKKVITQKFAAQKDDKTQEAVYLYPGLKTGDKVKVDTNCSRVGKLSREITVE